MPRLLALMARPYLVLLAITAVVLGANAPRGLTVAGLLFGAALAFGLLEVGTAALRLIRVPPDPASAWLAGLALAAYVIAVPVIILGWKLAASASVFLVLALACAALRRLCVDPLSRDDPGAALALIGAGGFALIWSLDTTLRYAGFAATGIVPACSGRDDACGTDRGIRRSTYGRTWQQQPRRCSARSLSFRQLCVSGAG